MLISLMCEFVCEFRYVPAVFFFFFAGQSTQLTAVPELTGLAVHSGQQQPGGLPNIVAVHREAASVFGVDRSHAHPLHQRRQHHERPVRGDRGTCSGHQRLHAELQSYSVYLSVAQALAKENPSNTEFACYFRDLAS